MVTAFERILIAVPDPDAAAVEYQQLLGRPALRPDGAHGPLFLLPNTSIELVAAGTDRAAIRGLALCASGPGQSSGCLVNSRGLEIRLGDGAETLAERSRAGFDAVADWQVDHIVLRTADADDCIALFGRQLGIRLALDKTVPEWGGRMLFFRAGKLTLEVIESTEPGEPDSFWGIAYLCEDLDRAAAGLAARGVGLSALRKGRKPGSRVATVKSHCLGIPTLLLEKN